MSLTELALEQVARPLRLRRNTAWIVAALGATLLLLGVDGVAGAARCHPHAGVGTCGLDRRGAPGGRRGLGTASRGRRAGDAIAGRVAGAVGCLAPRCAALAPRANATGIEQRSWRRRPMRRRPRRSGARASGALGPLDERLSREIARRRGAARRSASWRSPPRARSAVPVRCSGTRSARGARWCRRSSSARRPTAWTAARR